MRSSSGRVLKPIIAAPAQYPNFFTVEKKSVGSINRFEADRTSTESIDILNKEKSIPAPYLISGQSRCIQDRISPVMRPKTHLPLSPNIRRRDVHTARSVISTWRTAEELERLRSSSAHRSIEHRSLRKPARPIKVYNVNNMLDEQLEHMHHNDLQISRGVETEANEKTELSLVSRTIVIDHQVAMKRASSANVFKSSPRMLNTFPASDYIAPNVQAFVSKIKEQGDPNLKIMESRRDAHENSRGHIRIVKNETPWLRTLGNEVLHSTSAKLLPIHSYRLFLQRMKK